MLLKLEGGWALLPGRASLDILHCGLALRREVSYVVSTSPSISKSHRVFPQPSDARLWLSSITFDLVEEPVDGVFILGECHLRLLSHFEFHLIKLDHKLAVNNVSILISYTIT